MIFFDDEIITGASVCEGTRAVIDKGAKEIYAGCVHGTLAGDAVKNLLRAGVQHLAITDTIPLQNPSDKVGISNLLKTRARKIYWRYIPSKPGNNRCLICWCRPSKTQ